VTDKIAHPRPYTAVFYLSAAFLFLATLLRSVLLLGGSGDGRRALLLLAAWFALFVAAQSRARVPTWLFVVYLVVQAALVVVLLTVEDSTDFFAVLFAVLGMQVAQRLTLKPAAVCIALSVPLTALGIADEYDAAETVVSSLTFGAVTALAAYYAWSARTADEEQRRTESLSGRLKEANRDLRDHSDRVERLAVARERGRIARELHDSVTQTIFAMTLAARSLVLVPADDRERIEGQLDRLSQLAEGALSEMHVLIDELRPQDVTAEGLTAALRCHLAARASSDGLAVDLDAEGEEPLPAAEEQALFRIVQEALNNVAKHAGVGQASVRLRLREPFLLEVADRGRGFAEGRAAGGTGIGLTSMRERAAEIGWSLRIDSAPGEGTVVRVERATGT